MIGGLVCISGNMGCEGRRRFLLEVTQPCRGTPSCPFLSVQGQ